MRLRLLMLVALVLAVAGTFVVTGTSLVPTRLALGPCLRDWTSPSSYGTRQSPLAGTRFRVGEARVELCYGRPSLRGRQGFGGLVPYDSIWRLGANEPTRLYLDREVTFAGIPLAAGRYSVYAIPHPASWTILVSRSTLHWGNDISAAVRAREVGQAEVPVEEVSVPAETLTVTVEDDGAGDRARLVFSWERVRVPVEVARPSVPGNLGYRGQSDD